MPSPLLETKFYAPRQGRALVTRPRLIERLDRVEDSKLTLVSAPAGFGKTTLLAEWLAGWRNERKTAAWLSLDRADNESQSFWTHVIGSLQTAVPGVGSGALTLLEQSGAQPMETVLSTFLNELAAVPTELVIVLDDYHVVDAPDVQDQMAFVLDHVPPRTHVVIATRADPSLPLARLRARGELAEIRAADLRFGLDEASAYLNEIMGLHLAPTDVAALGARTEGWVAALQLAALSMQGRDDAASFISSFAGDDRYVVDYLVEEVLQRQSDDVRTFLVQTSVLDRLSGPLCDAVTGRDGGKVMLEVLERRNLFVVPLDDRRQWYRYHHLFADVLRARLLDEHSDLAPNLHQRASAWYERNGEPSEAIRHALAGDDFDRAADLIELAIPGLRQARQEGTLRRWLEALPDSLLTSRPVLSVHRAGMLLANGELDGADARLRDAERWLEMAEGASAADEIRALVRDEDGFRRLPAQIALYRAAHAQALGDVVGATAHAQRAVDLAGAGDDFERGGAAGFLGLVHWGRGELAAAHRYWEDAMASLRKAGHVVDAIGCARPVAQIRVAQGRLREAMSTYERGLQLASEQGGPVLRGAADMHVGMAEVLLEWNELEAAREHLAAAEQLGEQGGLAQNPYRWRVVMARWREAHGDLDGALELLGEARRRYVSEYYPDVRPAAALMARIWTLQDRLGEASDWVDERSLSADDDLSYLREFEHITLARVLVARSRGDGAEDSLPVAGDLLQRLLTAAEEGQRLGSVIEVLILQALASQRGDDVTAALGSLERALTLAEPERYTRLFVDEGQSMVRLLAAAARHGIAPAYVGRLLEIAGRTPDKTDGKHALVDPLSERELDVLRLLATELDGPGIAAELVVALSTIRSHTKSIYAKLGVNSRRAAVRRARELGLVSRASES